MKTKIHLHPLSWMAFVSLAFLAILAIPPGVAAQPIDDDPWALSFIGNYTDHQGFAAWDADGTGPEPYGVGHLPGIPGLTNYPYYASSLDYDDIDPDPGACLAHMINDNTGFTRFHQALLDHGYTHGQITVKSSLADLEDDLEGFDWFVIGNWSHTFYYNGMLTIFLDGEALVTLDFLNIDNHTSLSISGHLLESSYAAPDSAWQYSSNAVKEVGRALFEDLDGEELRLVGELQFTYQYFASNGRDGSFWNAAFFLEKGLPELPYQGLAIDHQGMAGWDADGSGPEPPADGHDTQLYYVASRDYDGIDPDPNAAFGHFLDEMKGFNNFKLQLAYRGYTPEQVKMKTDLCSLGDDVEGEDWGNTNGIYWNNYYDAGTVLELNGTPVITGLTDTSRAVWNNIYWQDLGTVDKPKKAVGTLSTDEGIIADALLKDLQNRYFFNEIAHLTAPVGYFSGNGRDGCYFNVMEARIVARCGEKCTFVQCDTLGTAFTGTSHWTVAHSPYYIDNSFVIPDGHVLVIDPGVEIQVRGAYEIEVKGSVWAIGGVNDRITFTRSNPLVSWDGFRYMDMEDAGPSEFSYCIFEHGATFHVVPEANNSGGIFYIRDFNDITISNCTFRHNKAEHVGGIFPPTGAAICLWNASPVIQSCEFYDNLAARAGAIQCYTYSSPSIQSCIFSGNTATEEGGAMSLREYCSPAIENCLFVNNYAGNLGGAIKMTNYCEPVLSHNTIAFNQAGDSTGPSWGGGIHILYESHPVLYENILWGNKAYNGTDIAGQIGIAFDGSLVDCFYNDIQGGNEGIGPIANTGAYENNIDADPEFCDYDELLFYLTNTSPCLTAGPGGNYIGAYDFGCYVELPEPAKQNNHFTIYPNPSYGPHVTLEVSLERSMLVTLDVYNMLGEKVSAPVSQWMPKGEHLVSVAMEDVPTGTYFCRLTTGHEAFTMKLVVFH